MVAGTCKEFSSYPPAKMEEVFVAKEN